MDTSIASGSEDYADPRISSSPTVTEVFDQLLAAVIRGELLPGERISDAELATKYGVSRTPVREALQRLREIGVVEAAPSRFTRVATVTPLQTMQAFVVWQALYAELLEEVIPEADPAIVAVLEADHADYLDGVATLASQQIATANFMFFTRIAQLTQNPILLRSLVSVVHIIRLGSLHLPAYIDFVSLGEAQRLMISAVRDRDLTLARSALALLRRIQVPQA